MFSACSSRNLALFISFIGIFAVSSAVAKPSSSMPMLKFQQRSFSFEIQPKSPILIRDLSAVILPVDNRHAVSLIEVIFYLENRSSKRIKTYGFQDPAEDGSDYKDYDERGSGGSLLPGESARMKLTMGVTGKSLIYRVKRITFEDGTEWKAPPFDFIKAQKSARFTPQPKTLDDIAKQKQLIKTVVKQQWQTAPVFADKVTKIINAPPEVIDGLEVRTKIHELKLLRLDIVDICDSKRAEFDATDEGLDYDVENFKSYEFRGKTFAYEIDYSLIEAADQYEIGAGIRQIYVDEEGNGTFKLRCQVQELKTLPAWIISLA